MCNTSKIYIFSDPNFKAQMLQTSLGNGNTILVRGLSEFNDAKSFDSDYQLELDPSMFVQTEDAASENVENTYSQVEFINGTAYMVAGHVDVGESLWEIEDGKLKKKDPKILINKLSDAKIKYPCPREGCSKIYSTPHHLKVISRGTNLSKLTSQRSAKVPTESFYRLTRSKHVSMLIYLFSL